MRSPLASTVVVLPTAATANVPLFAGRAQAGSQQIDLAAWLASGKLRAVNREVTATADREGAVHLSEQADNGIAWIEGSDFGDGAIEIEEFESPVKASVAPTGWAPLRLVVKGKTLQIYVGIYIGAVSAPTLEVRKLGSHDRGQVGLWGGNGSDGDFENLRIVPAK